MATQLNLYCRQSYMAEYRKQLWERSRLCRLCGLEIVHYQQSSIDHKVPRYLGGATIPENFQLAHKRCNAIKGFRTVAWNSELTKLDKGVQLVYSLRSI